MAADRTRRRVGIALLAMGVALSAGAVVHSGYHTHCSLERGLHGLNIGVCPGEVSVALFSDPGRLKDARNSKLSFRRDTFKASSREWMVWRDEYTRRSSASSDIGYLGFATPILAVETYLDFIETSCGLRFNDPGLNSMATRAHQIKVYRVAVASWLVPVPALLLGGFLFWSGRRVGVRSRSHGCTACGYSLRGLPVGTECPECGMDGAGRSRHDDHDGDDREKDVERD
ncbi:MAG: hypothetical protein HEQ23_10895 [Tepidisphaera sp.]